LLAELVDGQALVGLEGVVVLAAAIGGVLAGFSRERAGAAAAGRGCDG
jgi:hypothetical protein